MTLIGTLTGSTVPDSSGISWVPIHLPAYLDASAVKARAKPLLQRTQQRSARRFCLHSGATISSTTVKDNRNASSSLLRLQDEDSSNSAAVNQHVTAVVVGASIAGLLAAAALADWCKEVVVIEKDECADDAATVEDLQEEVFTGEARADTYIPRARRRRGVPQYGQLHGLLGKGAQAIESLLPGWRDIALQLGAISYQPGLLKTFYKGKWTYYPDAEAEFATLTASRDLIETCCRKQLLTLKSNVHICGGEPVRGLVWAGDCSSVHGVVMQSGAVIKGDLVVDASGRRSQMPAWLESAGYHAPGQEDIDPKVGYSVRLYEMPQEEQDSRWTAMYIRPAPPVTRGGILIKAEGGNYIASMIGYSGDIPPNDEAGHVEFLKSIQPPDLWEKLSIAKPLTKPAGFTGITNFRRFYERERLPSGLAIVGDAVCAFNPGMTVAAAEAEALQKLLQERAPSGRLTAGVVPDLATALQQAVRQIVAFPYQAATSEDFSFPGTAGKRPQQIWLERLMNTFVEELVSLQATDEEIFQAVTPVFHLVKGPETLMKPKLVWKALVSRLLRALEQ